MSETITPFKIDIPQTALDDLKTRLAMTRWPEQETVNDWSQGVPLHKLKALCEYWQNEYDWRSCEARLNAHPQFITRIDGLDIHFLHIRSPHDNALPMVMTHGWPGSVLEFMDVIGPLTNPTEYGGDANDAFHLVIPALPGYGFSGKPEQTGWSIERTANAWITLMRRLGYANFVAQGGDWGSAVTGALGNIHPPECLGIHLNMAIALPNEAERANLNDKEKAALASFQFYQDWDSGYSKQQSTRPQTVGYALADSPVGQAAWIYEKFYAWTDNNGEPEDALSTSKILDDISLYWLTNTAASSARLYWESFNSAFGSGFESDIPVGISIFPKEIFRSVKPWADRKYPNLRYWNELEKGGHFAAFEQPETFVNEVRSCFKAMR
jgi:pimeloyl-ACP methyl ester carboxylesterase